MQDEQDGVRLSAMDTVLVLVGFPWAVLLLLEQIGLLDPILRAMGV